MIITAEKFELLKELFSKDELLYKNYTFCSTNPSIDGNTFYWPHFSSDYYDFETGGNFKVNFQQIKQEIKGYSFYLIKPKNKTTFIAFLDSMQYKEDVTDFLVSKEYSVEAIRTLVSLILQTEITGDNVEFDRVLSKSKSSKEIRYLIDSIANEFIFFGYTDLKHDNWEMFCKLDSKTSALI